MKKKKLSRPKLPTPTPNSKKIRTVNGVVYMWIPNPLVKNGGYWRRAFP